MDVDKEQLRKRFPRLAQEIEGGEGSVPMTSIRSETETGEKAASEEFEGYNPDVIDFLRRCENEEQGEEVIRFLLDRKEISRSYASRLRRQLREKGVRSFGSKKECDYYLRRAGLQLSSAILFRGKQHENVSRMR